MKAIDGDSHFMEPMDLFERYIDPAFRERTVKMVRDPETGKATMLADNKPLKLRDVDQIMGLLVAYGEKEQGLNVGNFDRYLGYSQQWQDMDARVRFLDEEGFDKQVLYPSLGIVWEGEVERLGRRPYRVEFRMAEAVAADRRGGYEDGVCAELRDAFHLAHGELGIANRDVRGGKQAVLVRGDQLKGPGVVGAAERVG
jgi:hypothetical protein